MWGPWNATSGLTLSSRNPLYRSLCKRDKYFNWQNMSLIALSFSSEWLDRLILQRFKVQRYGTPKWAWWCYRKKGLLCSKVQNTVQKVQNTVQNACSTSAMACREHCILFQQKPDTLVAFTNRQKMECHLWSLAEFGIALSPEELIWRGGWERTNANTASW